MLIKEWRNAQMSILRQNELLTEEMQESYYQTVILPGFSQKEPRQILFSFLLKEECIGYGGIVHIDWPARRGEVSFLLDVNRIHDPVACQKEFSIYLQLIKQAAFQNLHFNRLYTETFDVRPEYVVTLESHGFIFEGRLRKHAFVNGQLVDSLIHGCVYTQTK